MTLAIFAFLLALGISVLLTPPVRHLAHRLGAIDHALDARKIHSRPIPRLGGLAIVGAFYGAMAVLACCDASAATLLLGDGPRTAVFLVGGLVVAGLGVHDDLHGATAWLKLLTELGVAGALYAAGYRLDVIALPFLEPVALGWLGVPVTLLWIAGVINAVNLVDGLDGLAAGVAAVASFATVLLALAGGSPMVAILAAALGGGALGFLRYNFNPASIFMGDTGSLFLGYVLAATSLRTQHEASTGVGLLASVLALGLPIADATLAVVRRTARGVPLFRADREHIHHRLLDSRLGHRGAVLVLYAASVLLSLAAVLVALGDGALVAAVLLTLSVAAPLALRRLGALRFAHTALAGPAGPSGPARDGAASPRPPRLPLGRLRLRRPKVALASAAASTDAGDAGRLA